MQSINKIWVVAVLLLLSASAYGAVIFSDNFDSCTTNCEATNVGPPDSADWGTWNGYASWDRYTSYGGVYHYSGEITSPGKGGTGGSLKMWRAGTAFGDYCGALELNPFPDYYANEHLFMSYWIKIPADWSSSQPYKLWRLKTSGGSGQSEIYLDYYYGDTWSIYDGSGWTTILDSNELADITDSAWHFIEWEVSLGSPGVLRMWVDDVIKHNESNRSWQASGDINGLMHFAIGNTQNHAGTWQEAWRAMEFDDFIISTTQIGSGGGSGDDSPPYVASNPAPQPARSSTGVLITNRTIHFHVHDDTDVLTADGVVNIELEDYTCGAGLTCTGGGTADLSVTYTKGSDWGYEQTVDVIVSGFKDTVGNTLVTDSWSYTTETSPATTLNITTATLPSGTMGTAYNQAIVAEGGTSPYTWMFQNGTLSPIPGSQYITQAVWDFANEVIGPEGLGSDMWPSTVHDDGSLWTSWGDGGGYNAPSTMEIDYCRTRAGVGYFTHTPPATPVFVDVAGCKADDSGCIDAPYYHDAACNAPYASTIPYWVEAVVSVNGNLYFLSGRQDGPAYQMDVYYSTNDGQTFSLGTTWPSTTGTFHPLSWIQFGADYSGSPGGYVYLVGTVNSSDPWNGYGTDLYLARVTKANILVQGSHEFFTGTSSNPTWGTWANRQPILTDPANIGWPSISYNPGIGRYIASGVWGDQDAGGCGAYPAACWSTINRQFIYEAPQPWGPYLTVQYTDTWHGFSWDNNWGLQTNFPTKWMSGDGKTMYGAWSGADALDRHHQTKLTLSIYPDNAAMPPGLSITSNGSVIGTPTTAGTYTFEVRVTDLLGGTDWQSFNIVIASATPGGQTTKTIPTDQGSMEDTLTTTNDTNYSTETYLQVYQWPAYDVENRILDNIVMGLPDNVSITSASLYMYMESWEGSGGTNPMRVYAYRVSDNVPVISMVTGNNFTGTLQAAESYTDVPLTTGWYPWNVTTMAQWAYANASPLHIALDGGQDGSADTNRAFTSREGSASFRPYLSVTYTSLVGPGGPSISAPGKGRFNKFKGTFR
jgi:hypothetical protein